jgi:type II secretory pathway pseudopilin PulG
MKSMKIGSKQQRGISLVEMLIAFALTGIVTSAVLKAYVTQHKNYVTQDSITHIQQNVRASIDELSRQCRMAGFAIPLGLPSIEAANTNPDTITVVYHDDGCDTYLDEAMASTTAELHCATDVSCFYGGQWVFIFEPDSGGGEFFEVSAVQTSTNRMEHSGVALSKAYTKDAIVLSLMRVKFYVDNTDPDHPNLMISLPGKSPHVYAENITDVQFSYRLEDGNVVNEPIATEDVREILISVTGRSAEPDPDRPEGQGYQTRTSTTSVALRNLGV